MITSHGLMHAERQLPGVTIATIPAPPRLSQEGRILAALRKPGGALPHVSITWLMRYYDHLAATLVFPFEARCPEEIGPLRP